MLSEDELTARELTSISETLIPIDRAALNCGTKDVIGQLRALAAVLYPDIDFSDADIDTEASDEASDEGSEE